MIVNIIEFDPRHIWEERRGHKKSAKSGENRERVVQITISLISIERKKTENVF